MAKSRSPNYPAIPLGDALEAIRPAYKAEQWNKMSRMVLAKHLGYGSLNGRALAKIGAVRAYGLIEGAGDELRVSDDAIKALNAPEGAPEKKDALLRCALRPSLFKDLHNEFPDGHVSVDNLRFWLIQRRFTEDAAEKAAENYLSTIHLVSSNERDYGNSDADGGGDDGIPDEDAGKSDEDSPLPRRKREVKPGMNEDTFAMKEGTVVFQWPDRLSAESYEDLAAWAELILRKVKRHVSEDHEPTDAK